ncbi:hypothetical protein F4778DRAFT_744038 [Xylariomycetidae sp. FL2044]|nr:hypothetical protein F4778DRAFT_744038 [Xylariomycetidae sp. FL2044]
MAASLRMVRSLQSRDNVNLVVYENIQPVVWGVTVPFVILCAASCVVRLYTRAAIVKHLGPDDWLMVAVFLVWIGQQYIAWMWTILGGGLHIDKVPVENQSQIAVYLFAEEFYYLFLQCLIKFSFLTFYLRTIATSDMVRKVVFVVMGVTLAQTIGTWIFYALQCIPIQAYFHPELYPDAVCINSDLSYYLPTVANVTVDFMVYILPILPISRIQVSLKRKLELIVVFTMGGCAITVSLLRFIVLWQLSNTTDTTYIFGSVTIVTTIEFATAIITANLPGVAAFWKHATGKDATKASTSGYGHNSNFEMGNMSTIGAKRQNKGFVKVEDNKTFLAGSSEEELTPMPKKMSSDPLGPNRDVWVQTQVKVETEECKPGSRLRKEAAYDFSGYDRS